MFILNSIFTLGFCRTALMQVLKVLNLRYTSDSDARIREVFFTYFTRLDARTNGPPRVFSQAKNARRGTHLNISSTCKTIPSIQTLHMGKLTQTEV